MDNVFDEFLFDELCFDESEEEEEVVYYWLKGGEMPYFILECNEE